MSNGFGPGLSVRYCRTYHETNTIIAIAVSAGETHLLISLESIIGWGWSFQSCSPPRSSSSTELIVGLTEYVRCSNDSTVIYHTCTWLTCISSSDTILLLWVGNNKQSCFREVQDEFDIRTDNHWILVHLRKVTLHVEPKTTGPTVPLWRLQPGCRDLMKCQHCLCGGRRQDESIMKVVVDDALGYIKHLNDLPRWYYCLGWCCRM